MTGRSLRQSIVGPGSPGFTMALIGSAIGDGRDGEAHFEEFPMKDETTAENIIRFPKSSRGAQAQLKEERKAALSEEQFKRSDANARTVVMRKFEDRRKKLNTSERATVACNLLRILDGLEQGSPSISKRDVLSVAGLVHGPTDSTKRLYYLAFDASKTGFIPEQRKARIKILAQDINKYVKIVRAAASLSGRDE